LAPLGEAYIETLRRGLYEECWADVYETANKRSGAYSWSAYGTRPVILLNWQNLFSDLFILAHEIGHAMHSYFTYQHQPYIYSTYTIFVAEVASTCNEALLFAHLLRTTTDAEQKRYLVSKQLDNISGTLFTQAMFAEFEHEVHDRVEHGEALAAERFTEIGARIEALYNGPDVVSDDTTGLFWALLPHYYMNFYVYKYATGISAGLALAHQILAEGQPAVERYLNFLRGGGSQSSACGRTITGAVIAPSWQRQWSTYKRRDKIRSVSRSLARWPGCCLRAKALLARAHYRHRIRVRTITEAIRVVAESRVIAIWGARAFCLP
jgi:oligoendopeptidase F